MELHRTLREHWSLVAATVLALAGLVASLAVPTVRERRHPMPPAAVAHAPGSLPASRPAGMDRSTPGSGVRSTALHARETRGGGTPAGRKGRGTP